MDVTGRMSCYVSVGCCYQMILCMFNYLISGGGGLRITKFILYVALTICSRQMTVRLWMQYLIWFGTDMSPLRCPFLLGDFFVTGYQPKRILWLVGSSLRRCRCMWLGAAKWNQLTIYFSRVLYSEKLKTINEKLIQTFRRTLGVQIIHKP